MKTNVLWGPMNATMAEPAITGRGRIDVIVRVPGIQGISVRKVNIILNKSSSPVLATCEPAKFCLQVCQVGFFGVLSVSHELERDVKLNENKF